MVWVVLDTGAFVSCPDSFFWVGEGPRDLSWMGSSVELVTVSSVLRELKDERARARLAILMDAGGTVGETGRGLHLREPSDEGLREVVRFAKTTGDYGSLSKTDLEVLALAWDLEVETVGKGNLRREPPPPPEVWMAGENLKDSLAVSENSESMQVDPDAGEAQADGGWVTVKPRRRSKSEKERSNRIDSAPTDLNHVTTEELGHRKTPVPEVGQQPWEWSNRTDLECDPGQPFFSETTLQSEIDRLDSPNGEKQLIEETTSTTVSRASTVVVDPQCDDLTKRFHQLLANEDNGTTDHSQNDILKETGQPATRKRRRRRRVNKSRSEASPCPPRGESGDEGTIGSPCLIAQSQVRNSKSVTQESESTQPPNAPETRCEEKSRSPDDDLVRASEAEESESQDDPPVGTSEDGAAAQFGEGLEGNSRQDEDFSSWIHPENVDDRIALDLGGLISSAEMKHRSGCITTDFAMQNVLLQMGLHLLSPDGKHTIRRLKKYVLRCYGCFKLTKDAEKQFCQHCGNHSLSRVTYAVDENGTGRLFLSPRYVPKIRGTKYSIPLPRGGRYNSDLILTEDVLAMRSKQLRSWQVRSSAVDVLDPTEVYNGSAKYRPTPDLVVGYGRRNPNQVRKPRK
eukprot:CAMPEP_0184688598 /NCGR_PEP_ID=MMETSP0312-20130426/30186_1 /TAXON_ID=31354 /ORGANISM="Compsopogon coeruleus, Strain SAG 36.94" /LENGTH=627 /DNA_ID=CAMNT_0027145851 /DNA_START=51 /DNA_END=1934 /DNA_ORIENTATION=+